MTQFSHRPRTVLSLCIAGLCCLLLLMSTFARAETDAGKKRYFLTEAHYAVPDIELLDHRGEVVALKAMLNESRPVMLQFVFTTCPSICPVLAAIFAGVQKKLDGQLGDLLMVSVSIDPEHDTPETLRHFARKFEAGPQWRFLTGRYDAVQTMQKAFDAYRGNKMSHEPLTYLRVSPQAPWVRIEGFLSAAELISEYEQLKD